MSPAFRRRLDPSDPSQILASQLQPDATVGAARVRGGVLQRGPHRLSGPSTWATGSVPRHWMVRFENNGLVESVLWKGTDFAVFRLSFKETIPTYEFSIIFILIDLRYGLDWLVLRSHSKNMTYLDKLDHHIRMVHICEFPSNTSVLNLGGTYKFYPLPFGSFWWDMTAVCLSNPGKAN